MKRSQQSQKLKTKQSNPPQETATQSFMEHIYELRGRLTWVILTLVSASALAYQFRDQLVHVVMAPLHGNKLVYLNPGGGLTFVFTVCLYFGALLTIPVAIYHLFKFLQPVLRRRSRTLVLGIVSTSIFLAVLGVVFGYLLVIPGAIHFLGEFSGGAVVANLTTDAYLNFVVLHLFGMALLFQLPLLLFIADHIRPLPPGTLFKLQRWVVAGSIVAAAIISPAPDPVNLAMVAMPIIAVYEVGVIVVWSRRRSYHRANKKTHKVQKIQKTAPRRTTHETNAVLPQGIIEALNEVSQTTPAPQQVQVPAIVGQASVRQQVKSIDGFRVRKAPQGVAVPPSRLDPRTHYRPNTSGGRTRRASIDGIL